MSTFTVEIYDTREDVIGTVRGVPAETLEEACKKVAEKKGYHWIGAPRGSTTSYYVIDLHVYNMWNNDLSEEDLKKKLEADSVSVKNCNHNEFRGLYEMYESDLNCEEWSD